MHLLMIALEARKLRYWDWDWGWDRIRISLFLLFFVTEEHRLLRATLFLCVF